MEMWSDIGLRKGCAWSRKPTQPRDVEATTLEEFEVSHVIGR